MIPISRGLRENCSVSLSLKRTEYHDCLTYLKQIQVNRISRTSVSFSACHSASADKTALWLAAAVSDTAASVGVILDGLNFQRRLDLENRIRGRTQQRFR